MSFELVSDGDGLTALSRTAKGLTWVGLDTEFMRVRTYYPRLCLVQLAVGPHVYCIDPLAVEDLSRLKDIFADSSILKVVHSARQDIEVLYHYLGIIPQPLFDTQVAAALAGYGAQVGYAALVKSVVGPDLGKTLTRTDWCARPLTSGQLRYAVDDVKYLGQLCEVLQDELEQAGRTPWLEQEAKELTDPALYSNDPEQAYRRLGQGRTLEPVAQQTLRSLATWREGVAQQLDLPREWVITDKVLVALARVAPADRAVLNEIEGAHPRWIDRWGKTVLDIVHDSQTLDPEPLWNNPSPLTSEQEQLSKALLQRVRGRAEQLGIAPSLLGTRRDIERLVRGKRDLALLRGWRQQVIGDELLARM